MRNGFQSGFAGSRSSIREWLRLKVEASRLTQPLEWRQPQRIFVNSMSDLFIRNSEDLYRLGFDTMESRDVAHLSGAD